MKVDVSDFMLHYPSITDKNFQRDLNRLNEFNSLKLKPREPLEDKKGAFLKHQEAARRLINNETPYKKMLFEHEPGSGKTCIIEAINEWNITETQRLAKMTQSNKGYLKETDEDFSRRPMIFVANDTQVKNLTYMLALSCAPDKYEKRVLEEAGDTVLDDKQKKRKMRQFISYDYDFQTYEQFALKLSSRKKGGEEIPEMTDEMIIKRYSNRMMILDEAHHLRITNDRKIEDSLLYNAFYRLLHVAQNIKVILLTGTAESDKAEDFAFLMNLILPENEQLPIKNYNIIMFNEKNDKLTSEGERLLIKAIRGRVSYLRAPEGETDVEVSGQFNPWKEGEYDSWVKNASRKVDEDSIPWTLNTKVVPLMMSEFQEKIVRASGEDTTTYTKKGGKIIESTTGGVIFHLEKDAAIIVWPDGSYGSKGKEAADTGNKYVTVEWRGGKDSGLAKAGGRETVKYKKYSLSKDHKHIIENLEKYSVKYHYILGILKNRIKHGGKVFIFAPIIDDLVVLSLFMEKILGYSNGVTVSNWNSASKKPRYAILTGSTITDSQLTKTIDVFNEEANSRGEYINVILGTEKVSEGLTLKGIRDFISFRSDHRRKFLLQAEKRGLRLGAHLQLTPAERNITIHRLVVAYRDKDQFSSIPTRDIIIFRDIEIKDSLIKVQKRLRKKYAVDCVPNYARNVLVEDKKNSNECDNTECNYTCAESIPEYINKSGPVWKYKYPKDYLNHTNYNILYSEDDKRDMVAVLKTLFQEKNSYTFTELCAIFSKYNELLVMQTLIDVIDNNITMYTRYGSMTYLHEEGDVFFVDTTFCVVSTKCAPGAPPGDTSPEGEGGDVLYTENRKSLGEMLAIIDNGDASIVKSFCDAVSVDEKLEILLQLKGELLTLFVETFFLIKNKTFGPLVQDFFNRFVSRVDDGNIVHYLNYEDFSANSFGVKDVRLEPKGKMKFLSSANNVWMCCPIVNEKIYINEIKKKREDVRSRRYNEDVRSFGVAIPGDPKHIFRLSRKISMNEVCFKKANSVLTKATYQLSIDFTGSKFDVPPSYVKSREKDPNLDKVQNHNISRMLDMADYSKHTVCKHITEEIRKKMKKVDDLIDTAKKDLKMQDMIDMVIEYDIVIKDVNTPYPSLEDLRKLGYKGPELAPFILKSLMFIYKIWHDLKESAAQASFRKSVKLNTGAIGVIYRSFNVNSKGRVCSTISKDDLAPFAIAIIPPENVPQSGMSREDMLSSIKSRAKYGFFPEELDSFDDVTLNTIIFVFKTEVRRLAEILYDSLDDIGLIYPPGVVSDE